MSPCRCIRQTALLFGDDAGFPCDLFRCIRIRLTALLFGNGLVLLIDLTECIQTTLQIDDGLGLFNLGVSRCIHYTTMQMRSDFGLFSDLHRCAVPEIPESRFIVYAFKRRFPPV
jgi:hypothetical protein